MIKPVGVMKWLDGRLPRHPLSSLHSAIFGELLHLSLDVTGTCNLDCVMCALRKWHTPGPFVSDAVLQRLTPVFAKVRSVDLYSECEPLLHPGLPGILRQVKVSNSRARTHLVTNATLLTPRLSLDLLTAGLDVIGFSVDSPRPATYEQIRRGAKLNQVLENIREFMRVRSRTVGPHTRTYLIVVLSKLNVTDLLGLVNLASNLDITCIRVNGLEPYSPEMSSAILYGIEATDTHRASLEEARTFAQKRGVHLMLPALNFNDANTCILRRCLVDSSGHVYPCAAYAYEKPCFLNGERHLHPRLSFGNVLDRGFWEIWHSPEYRAFRSAASGRAMPPPCKRCLARKGVIHPN